MINVTIRPTQDPTILKFELPDFITQNENFEFNPIIVHSDYEKSIRLL